VHDDGLGTEGLLDERHDDIGIESGTGEDVDVCVSVAVDELPADVRCLDELDD